MPVPDGPPGVPPAAWHARLASYGWTAQTIGRSGAAVFRLTAPGRPDLFIKIEPRGPLDELRGEAQRLRWLAAHGQPCPQVMGQARTHSHDWLFMRAIPGLDLASSPALPPARVVAIAASALRALHGLDVADCPFDHRAAIRIEHARQRVQAGRVDAGDFDAERLGQSAAQAFAALQEQRPAHEDLVVTHGDACLPNLMANDSGFTGFVDCGRLGVADRHQDLALAAWSIQYNLGADWVPAFLDAYGGNIDPARLAFYRLLDEFF
ncbi:APH(3')-II family aminoglycoside O-phosphotransferase [Bordetella sp. BOR01]|uniref:APH(3')-II family aminoglycoside O-phosphotransferase n=1 Tax=Bordetella sp. BOR01 TaxID=2854779 RepID=UPI001C4934BB|nr:APH(3') family aminoglycoside O-phosphotransferase [Bordetella sp. BOR01]MBV7482742.1 aminoglycoside 3'-phosphotransferase [Bordetella sp. BOR01]